MEEESGGMVCGSGGWRDDGGWRVKGWRWRDDRGIRCLEGGEVACGWVVCVKGGGVMWEAGGEDVWQG